MKQRMKYREKSNQDESKISGLDGDAFSEIGNINKVSMCESKDPNSVLGMLTLDIHF